MTTTTSDLPRFGMEAAEAGTSSGVLVVALAIAGLIHMGLLLAVSFVFPKASPGEAPTLPLEIVVLRQAAPSDEKPEIADAFAQVDRAGGGVEKAREVEFKPSIESVQEILDPAPDLTPDESLAPSVPPLEPMPAFESQPPFALAAQPLTATLEPEPEWAESQEPELSVELAASTPEPESALMLEPLAEPPPPRVTTAEIMASRSLEIAELTTRIQHSSAAYANRPRRKAISASTRELKYASYQEAWRRKVLRVGNLNYPEEAKRRKMYGDLILHVAVRADGSIEQLRVIRSSGFELLDEAAIRIVELAAPFAPFPPDIRAETDILDITRTWRFLSSNRLGWEN